MRAAHGAAPTIKRGEEVHNLLRHKCFEKGNLKAAAYSNSLQGTTWSSSHRNGLSEKEERKNPVVWLPQHLAAES